MATDRELAAQSMMQAGIGSLSGRPSRPRYETVGDEMRGEGFLETVSGKKILPTLMDDWGGRPTPEDIRQDAINWGQQAGLGNRISFAGEGGRDILNPNEMRMNAPSISDWKQMARQKMHYDNTQGYTENLNDLMRDVGSDIWGGVKEKIGGVGDTISDWFKYGWSDPESRWEGSPYELDEFEFNLLHPDVDFEGVLPGERTIDREGEEYQRLQELEEQLRNQWQGDISMTQGLPGTEVAQAAWKRKDNWQALIDLIMKREGFDTERDAKTFIFDNYGLAV